MMLGKLAAHLLQQARVAQDEKMIQAAIKVQQTWKNNKIYRGYYQKRQQHLQVLYVSSLYFS